MNGIFSNIKTERRLSFQHWRYRLLHWTFGVSPKTPGESDLPKPLYTHYCPLFHVTNLLALALPLLILGKISWCFVKAGWRATAYSFKSFANFFDNTATRMKQKKVTRKRTVPKEKVMLRVLKGACLSALEDPDLFFDYVRGYVGEQRIDNPPTRDEIQVFWEKYAPLVKRARQRVEAEQEARRKKRHDQMVFWSNVSHGVIKWGLIGFYSILAAGVAWMMWNFGLPALGLCWQVTAFLFNLLIWTDWSWVIGQVLTWTTITLVLSALAYGLYKSLWIVRTPVNYGCEVVSSGVDLCGSVLYAVKEHTESVFGGIADFVGTFYEENCPPVVIVGEEEEVEVV